MSGARVDATSPPKPLEKPMALDLRRYDGSQVEYNDALNREGIEPAFWLFHLDEQGKKAGSAIEHLAVRWASPAAAAEVACGLCGERTGGNLRAEILRFVASLPSLPSPSRGVRCPHCGAWIAGVLTDPRPIWASGFKEPPFQAITLSLSCPGALERGASVLWPWKDRPEVQVSLRGAHNSRLGAAHHLRLTVGGAEAEVMQIEAPEAGRKGGAPLDLSLPVLMRGSLAAETRLRVELVCEAHGAVQVLGSADLTLTAATVRARVTPLSMGTEHVTLAQISLETAGGEVELPASACRSLRIGGSSGSELGPESRESGVRVTRWFAWRGRLHPEAVAEALTLEDPPRKARVRLDLAGPRSVTTWSYEAADLAGGGRARGVTQDGLIRLNRRLTPGTRIMLRVAAVPADLPLAPDCLGRAGFMTLAEDVAVGANGVGITHLGGRTFTVIGQRDIQLSVVTDQVDEHTAQLVSRSTLKPGGASRVVADPVVVWLAEDQWSFAVVRLSAVEPGGEPEPVEIVSVESHQGLIAEITGPGRLQVSGVTPGKVLSAGSHALELQCRIDGQEVTLPLSVEICPRPPLRPLPQSREGSSLPFYAFPLPPDDTGRFDLFSALSEGERDRVRRSYNARQTEWIAARLDQLSGDALTGFVHETFGTMPQQAAAAWGRVVFTASGPDTPERLPPVAGTTVGTASGGEYRLVCNGSPWQRDADRWVSEAMVSAQTAGAEGHCAAAAICRPPMGHEELSVTNPEALLNSVPVVDEPRLRAYAKLHAVITEFPWDRIPAPRSQLVIGEDSFVPLVLSNPMARRLSVRFLGALRGRVSIMEVPPWDFARQLGYVSAHRTQGGLLRDLPSAAHPADRPTVASIRIEPDSATVVLLRIRLERALEKHESDIDLVWFDVEGFVPLRMGIPVVGVGTSPVLSLRVGPVGMDVGSFASKAMFQYEDQAGLQRDQVHAVQWAQNCTCIPVAEDDRRDLFPSRLTVLALHPHPKYPDHALPRYTVAGEAATRLGKEYEVGATRHSKSRVSLTGGQQLGVERLSLPRDEAMGVAVLAASMRNAPRPAVVDLPLYVEVRELFKTMVSHLTESLFESLPTLPRAVYTARPTTLSPHDLWLYHHLLGAAYESAVRSRLLQDRDWLVWDAALEAIDDLLPPEVQTLADLPPWLLVALEQRFSSPPSYLSDLVGEWFARASAEAAAVEGGRRARSRYWFCAAVAALASPACEHGRIDENLPNQLRVREAVRSWLGHQASLLHPPTVERFAAWVASRVPGLDCATDEPTASIAGVVAAAISEEAGDLGLRRALENIGVSPSEARRRRWLSLDFGAGTNDIELIDVSSTRKGDWGDEEIQIRPIRETHSHYAGIYATNVMCWLLLVLGKMRMENSSGGALIRNDRLRELAQRPDGAQRAAGMEPDRDGYLVDPLFALDELTDPNGFGDVGFGGLEDGDRDVLPLNLPVGAPPPAEDAFSDAEFPKDNVLQDMFRQVREFLFDSREARDGGQEGLHRVRKHAAAVARTLLPDLQDLERPTRSGFWELAELAKIAVCSLPPGSRPEALFDEYRRWVMPGYEATFDRVVSMLHPAELSEPEPPFDLVMVLSGRAARDPVMVECARRFASRGGYPLLHLGEGSGQPEHDVEGRYAFFPGWPGFHPVSLGLLAREGVMLTTQQIRFDETLLNRLRLGVRVRVGTHINFVIDRERLLSTVVEPAVSPSRPPRVVTVAVDVLDDRLARPGAPHWTQHRHQAVRLDQPRNWWRSAGSRVCTDVARGEEAPDVATHLPYSDAGVTRIWVMFDEGRDLRVYLELEVKTGGDLVFWTTLVSFDTLRSYSLRAPFEDDEGAFWRP